MRKGAEGDYFEFIQTLSIFRPLPKGEIGCSGLERLYCQLILVLKAS
jgi:hypothetical protein